MRHNEFWSSYRKNVFPEIFWWESPVIFLALNAPIVSYFNPNQTFPGLNTIPYFYPNKRYTVGGHFLWFDGDNAFHCSLIPARRWNHVPITWLHLFAFCQCWSRLSRCFIQAAGHIIISFPADISYQTITNVEDTVTSPIFSFQHWWTI